MTQDTVRHETLRTPTLPERADAGLSALGALASFGALLAAGSCCVLPLALAALGVGAGVSSAFAVLMPLRWPLTALALVGLATGWLLFARRRRDCAAAQSCTAGRPARSTPIILSAGTILTLIALIWDRLETPLMKALS